MAGVGIVGGWAPEGVEVFVGNGNSHDQVKWKKMATQLHCGGHVLKILW
jgi:hypothetical protein